MLSPIHDARRLTVPALIDRDLNQNAHAADHDYRAPWNTGHNLFFGSEPEAEGNDGEDDGDKADVDSLVHRSDGRHAGEEHVQDRENKDAGKHQENQVKVDALPRGERFGFFETHVLADVPVPFGNEAEKGDEDQGEYYAYDENHAGRAERVEFGDGCAFDGVVHEAAENDAQVAGHEVAAGEGAGVDGYRADDRAHLDVVAQQQRQRRHKGDNSEIARADGGNERGDEKQDERKKGRVVTEHVEQVAGELFERAVDEGEIVEKRHRHDGEHDAGGPCRNHRPGSHVEEETAQGIPEDDGEEADVQLRLVPENDGRHDRRDNQETDHCFPSAIRLCQANRPESYMPCGGPAPRGRRCPRGIAYTPPSRSPSAGFRSGRRRC